MNGGYICTYTQHMHIQYNHFWFSSSLMWEKTCYHTLLALTITRHDRQTDSLHTNHLLNGFNHIHTSHLALYTHITLLLSFPSVIFLFISSFSPFSNPPTKYSRGVGHIFCMCIHCHKSRLGSFLPSENSDLFFGSSQSNCSEKFAPSLIINYYQEFVEIFQVPEFRNTTWDCPRLFYQ